MAGLRRQPWLLVLPFLLILNLIGIVACGQRPIPLPNQDIQLVCTDPPAFCRYDLATGMSSEDGSFERVFPLLNILPTEHGAIPQGKPVVIGETQSKTILWHEGEAFSEFDGMLDPAPVLPFGWVDPGKRRLAFSLGNTGLPGMFTLLDIDSCDSSGCDAKPLVGLPVWSPDSSQMIVMQNTTLFPDSIVTTESFLSRGNREGQSLTPIGTGFSPFWLDNETYGYIRHGVSETWMREIVIASIANDEAQVLLTLEDLLETVPADHRLGKPSIRYIAVNPSDANLLGIQLSDLLFYKSYVFLYERSEDPSQAGDVSLRLEVDDILWGLFFSPDGLRLTAGRHEERERRAWELHVHDIDQNKTRIFTSDFSTLEPQRSAFHLTGYDWSSDGKWLAKINDGVIDLIAPGYDYAQEIEHDFPLQTCPIVAWTNRAEDQRLD